MKKFAMLPVLACCLALSFVYSAVAQTSNPDSPTLNELVKQEEERLPGKSVAIGVSALPNLVQSQSAQRAVDKLGLTRDEIEELFGVKLPPDPAPL